MFSWIAHHEEWEYRLWRESEILELGLTNQRLWDEAERISPQAVEQFRSDIARYEILYRFGGVYVDADFECRSSLDHLLDVEVFAGIVGGRWLNNALLGATPGHVFLEELIRRLPENVRRFAAYEGNSKRSGPQFMTPIARKFNVTALPEKWFYPYLWNELDREGEEFPDALAVHRWHNRRRRVSSSLRSTDQT